MMEQPFHHGDIVAQISGLPTSTRLLFLPCRDKVVKCRVRLRFLEGGSIHPTAAGLLKKLDEARIPLSLEQLAKELGAAGTIGMRFISEFLARLHHAGEIILKNHGGSTTFQVAPTSMWRVGPRSFTVTRTLDFVPRSRQLASRIPDHRKIAAMKIKWWNPPDNQLVYSKQSLSSNIEQVCRRYVGSEREITRSHEAQEMLHRARILRRQSELLEAKVLETSTASKMVVHRCYFTLSRSSDLICIGVFRLSDLARLEGYTTYVREAVGRHAGFAEEILRIATPVERN